MSKKNLIAGQSGGPTAAINSSLYGVVSEALKHTEEIDHVYGMVNGIEGFLNGTVLDFQEALPGLPLQASGIPGGSGLSEAFSEIRGDEHRLVLLYRRQRFHGYRQQAFPLCRKDRQ